MRFLGRLVLVPLGLCLAIPAGMVSLAVAALLDPAAGGFARLLLWGEAFALSGAWANGTDELYWHSAQAFGWASTLLVAPPLFVALIGEVAGLRSLAWYAGGTGVVTALIPWLMREADAPALVAEGHLTLILAAVGAGSGFVYWLVAGQSAGAPKSVSGPASSGS